MIIHVMSVIPPIPDNPEQCQQLLVGMLRRNDELRRQAEDAQRQAEDAQRQAEDAQRQAEDAQRQAEDAQRRVEAAERRITEVERVLEATAADYSRLQEEHAELAETLA